MQKYILSLLIAALLFSFGCKKDKTGDSETPVHTGISLKVDGIAWTAKQVNATYNPQTKIAVINGINSSMDQMVELVFQGDSVGIYTFTNSYAYPEAVFAINTGVDSYYASLGPMPAGQLVVTNFDKTNHTLSGTFHFIARNPINVQKTITDGKFTKVAYLVY